MGFIRFIHRTAIDLHADEIVESIGKRLEDALQDLVGYAADDARMTLAVGGRWYAGTNRALVAQSGRGYVQTIDYAGLLVGCLVSSVTLRAPPLGQDKAHFAGNGMPFSRSATWYWPSSGAPFGPVRTSIKDPEYPITQLNQVATRAFAGNQ